MRKSNSMRSKKRHKTDEVIEINPLEGLIGNEIKDGSNVKIYTAVSSRPEFHHEAEFYHEAYGWGALLDHKGTRKELYGGKRGHDDKHMFLLAAAKALKSLNRPCKVELYTGNGHFLQSAEKYINKLDRYHPTYDRELWRYLRGASVNHSIKWNSMVGDTSEDIRSLLHLLAEKGRSEEFLRKKKNKNEGLGIFELDSESCLKEQNVEEQNVKRSVDICIKVDSDNPTGKGRCRWEGIILYESGMECQRLQGENSYITQPRMCLLATIKILEKLENCSDILFFTDTDYLRIGMWNIKSWKSNGWQRYDDGEEKYLPLANKDLWMKIYELLEGCELSRNQIKCMVEAKINIEERMSQIHSI